MSIMLGAIGQDRRRHRKGTVQNIIKFRAKVHPIKNFTTFLPMQTISPFNFVLTFLFLSLTIKYQTPMG